MRFIKLSLSILTMAIFMTVIMPSAQAQFVCSQPPMVCEGATASDRTATTSTAPKIVRSIQKSIKKFRDLMKSLGVADAMQKQAQTNSDLAVAKAEMNHKRQLAESQTTARMMIEQQRIENDTAEFTQVTAHDCVRATGASSVGESDLLTSAAQDASFEHQAKVNSRHRDTKWGIDQQAAQRQIFNNVVRKYCRLDSKGIGEICEVEQNDKLVNVDMRPDLLLGQEGTWDNVEFVEAYEQMKFYFLGNPDPIMNTASMQRDTGRGFMQTKAMETRKNLASYLMDYIAGKRQPTVPDSDFVKSIFQDNFRSDQYDLRQIEQTVNAMSTNGKTSQIKLRKALNYDRFGPQYFMRDNFLPNGGVHREFVYNLALHLQQNYEQYKLDEMFNVALASYYSQMIE